jgi:hypothetical protein
MVPVNDRQIETRVTEHVVAQVDVAESDDQLDDLEMAMVTRPVEHASTLVVLVPQVEPYLAWLRRMQPSEGLVQRLVIAVLSALEEEETQCIGRLETSGH